MYGTASNRTASRPTKARACSTWSWRRMWIANRPERLAPSAVRAWRWQQTSTIGGSSETLVNELAAIPHSWPSICEVTMVTPVG